MAINRRSGLMWGLGRKSIITKENRNIGRYRRLMEEMRYDPGEKSWGLFYVLGIEKICNIADFYSNGTIVKVQPR